MGSILDGLVDEKIKSILSVFVRNRDELFHLKKISELSNVPIATSFRVTKKLVKLGLISEIKINKFKVYRVAEDKKIKLLINLLGK